MNIDIAPAAARLALRTPAPRLDRDLVSRFGVDGPRYRSYPTTDRFTRDVDARRYRRHLARRNTGGLPRALALYLHFPFGAACSHCRPSRPFPDRAPARGYASDIEREIALVDAALAGNRRVATMHWGGDAAGALSETDCARLVHALGSTFDFAPNGERVVRVDPRRADTDRIAHLASLGFNRLSIAVRDADETRREPGAGRGGEQTLRLVDAARRLGFRGIDVGLSIGSPDQTERGFATTLERAIDCDPDRIEVAVMSDAAGVPVAKRRMASGLSGAGIGNALLEMAFERLGDAGYDYIGIDQFAKPADALAVAQRNGTLTRDLQGYTAAGVCDVLGFGVSAIAKVGAVYARNAKSLDEYRVRLARNDLPVEHGVELGYDDLIRAAVIQSLACHFEISKEAIGIAHLVDFDRYFVRELVELQRFAAEGALRIEGDLVAITPRGRPLIPAICRVFDRYLRATRGKGPCSP
jgi:oxygen-independent coproporphyrinogen-3 oxidase